MTTWGKLRVRQNESPDDVCVRNITKSSQIRSNSENASPAAKSGSNDPHADSNSSRSVRASRASGKSRTTAVNGVVVARSGNMNSKSKKLTKKSRAIEISDSEDDDSLERGAALASPAKGMESRKDTKVSKSFIYLHYIYCD